ncbi:MAG: hypothetical protein GY953_44195 [bacterium]|nr:hypothetical protein [bacterium]
MNDVLRFLHESGGPEIRKATVAAARALPALWMLAGDTADEPTDPASEQPDVRAAFGKLPLSFEPNIGQAGQGVDYFARGPGYGVYLSAREAVLVQAKPGGDERGVARLALAGSSANARASSEHPLSGKSHYLIGDQPSEWRTDVPHSARVRYREVYPGIDIVYYGNGRRLEFDFEVSPGTDPNLIQLSFPETERVELDLQGNLLLASAAYSLKLERPVV